MDEPYEKRERSPSPARMSKVPSWISVGFVLGLFAGWALKPAPPPVPGPERIVEVVRFEPRPTTVPAVEALFEAWRRYAAWDDNDVTEIAVFNVDRGEFAEFYEVKRINGLYYFHGLTKLTRRLSANPMPVECPLRFTEPDAGASGGLLVVAPTIPRQSTVSRRPRDETKVVAPAPVVPKIEPLPLPAPVRAETEKR